MGCGVLRDGSCDGKILRPYGQQPDWLALRLRREWEPERAALVVPTLAGWRLGFSLPTCDSFRFDVRGERRHFGRSQAARQCLAVRVQQTAILHPLRQATTSPGRRGYPRGSLRAAKVPRGERSGRASSFWQRRLNDRLVVLRKSRFRLHAPLNQVALAGRRARLVEPCRCNSDSNAATGFWKRISGSASMIAMRASRSSRCLRVATPVDFSRRASRSND